MTKLGPFGNCCLALTFLGTIFYFYITLICLLSPDRLHILKHKSPQQDNELYSTAWSTSATCTFLYMLIFGGLMFYKFYDKESREGLKKWIDDRTEGGEEDVELEEMKKKSRVMSEVNII